MAVAITALAHQRLWTFIDNFQTEVGGFGAAHICEQTSDVIWDDTFLIPQFVSKSEVDFSGDALFNAVERLGDRLGEPNFVLVSWHSHGDLDVFWSGTDEKCIDTYRDAGVKLLVSFVGNLKHKYKVRVDYFDVEHRGLKLKRIKEDDMTLFLDQNDPIFGEAFAEMDKNVKKRPAVTYNPPQWGAPHNTQSSHQLVSPSGSVNANGANSSKDDDDDWPGSALQRSLDVRTVMNAFDCEQEEAEDFIDNGGDVMDMTLNSYDDWVNRQSEIDAWRETERSSTGPGVYGHIDYYHED